MNDPRQFRAPQVQLRIEDTSAVACPCGSEIFTRGTLVRRVSGILTGGKTEFVPLDGIIYCVKCYKPMAELLPDELKPVIDIESTIIESK